MAVTAHAAVGSSGSFMERVNSDWHEIAMRSFMVVVLGHWMEHFLQTFQIYVLGWPVPQARGMIGMVFPSLVTSEVLHYGYALVMLLALWALRPGFTGKQERWWWTLALGIQFFHHFEHALLQLQVLTGHNLFGRPMPTSIAQLWVPRVELHLFYNTIVFVPMIVGMYYHLFPPETETGRPQCSCAWHSRSVASPV
jgi:hypothetical protein